MPSRSIAGGGGRRCRGYTLLELMIVVAIMGIAAALVIPNMGGADPLRVQTSVRALAADIMFTQSDALAYQARRAVVFDPDTNSYWIAEVSGSTLDFNTDVMFRIDGPNQRYLVDIDTISDGAAQLVSADFDGEQFLVFDELGGPVAGLTSDTPSAGGEIIVNGDDGLAYRIRVEAYTGRVVVERIG